MILKTTAKRSFALLIAVVLVTPVLALSVGGHWMLLQGDVCYDGTVQPLHELGAFVAAMFIGVGNSLMLVLGRRRLKPLEGAWALLPTLLFSGTFLVFYLQNFAFDLPFLFWANLLLTIVTAAGIVFAPLIEESRRLAKRQEDR